MTLETSSKTSKESQENLQKNQSKITLSSADIKAKGESFKKFRAAKIWLEGKFPKSFNFKDPKPLKLGIQHDLLSISSPFSKSLLRKCLGVYVNTKTYLEATVQGRWRYNLNGEEIEEVTQEQKEYALNQLQCKKELSRNNKKRPSEKGKRIKNTHKKSL